MDKRQSKAVKNNRRIVGRWFIGDTLGQGGYSWVKKGHDKETGKIVALKFMKKADETWAAEQKKQVSSEIEALRKVRHPNVLRLFAYNLKTKYPERNGTHTNVSLLVLEYAEGGELFDVLYYTHHLEIDIARTYFYQLISGLYACHSKGVIHRDIKPQNLLLDASFHLKIADFGLSKILAASAVGVSSTDDSDVSSGSEEDAASVATTASRSHSDLMYTTYVGTRGYQAPEILRGIPFTASCDIFSAGVVLFILLNGYPPFNDATSSDAWYKLLINGNSAKFWNRHHNSQIVQKKRQNSQEYSDAMNLIERMLEYDMNERISLQEILEHPFVTEGDIIHGRRLISRLREIHRQAIANRRQIDDLGMIAVQKLKRGLDDEKENVVRKRRVFDSHVDVVHLTDWISSVNFDRICEEIVLGIEETEMRCEWKQDMDGVLSVIAECVGMDIEMKSRVVFWIEFYERRDERTLIRVTRKKGNVMAFHNLKHRLEQMWMHLLE